MNNKPWDARLAAWLVGPLVDRPIHPNVLTTVRLLVGLVGALLFAGGEHYNTAAAFIVLSNFLDHSDGELARMSGKTSLFGHRYDLASDALVTVGLFVGLGIGLENKLGAQALTFGAVSGLAVAGIFHVRQIMESRYGKVATRQAKFVGFETEDILYLLPLVTLSDQQANFLKVAAVGAPIAFVIVVVQFYFARKSHDEVA